MVEIKSYLGFTNNIKEPRKTNIEDTLEHLYRYNGKIMSAINFLCTKLLEGGYLKVEENYTTLKRNGERTKPRTLYMFFDKDTKTYTELKKTEYNFVQYLIDNKIDTEEKMLALDKANIEKMEADKRAEEEARRLEEDRERQLKEEESKFKEWMFAETVNLEDSQIEIINSIFRELYGKEDSWNYTLAVCINNYDKPRCKDEVKSRLHNDNKASIKIFECLTGLKLPKGYKDRMTYLDSITSADFKEAVGYKTHNKSEKKEVNKEEFYILLGNFTWKKVFAEPVVKYGIKMFLFCDCGTWKLSHEELGCNIVSGKTKTECIQKLKEYMDKNGKDKFNELVERNRKTILEKAGVNPRLASEVA